MESLNLKTYLIYAIYIVRTNPLVLIFLGAIGLLNGITVYFPDSTFANLIGSITIVGAIFISPVIYGIYYEIVEGRYSSVANIFRTYVVGYLLLLFCMYIPIIIAAAFLTSATQPEAATGTVMLTILVFSLLFIYVVPAYYISGKILDSISYGVIFFFRHIVASAPLLIIALVSDLLLLLSNFKLGALMKESPTLFVTLDFSIYLLASILDFILFIMLIYVLRRQEDLIKR